MEKVRRNSRLQNITYLNLKHIITKIMANCTNLLSVNNLSKKLFVIIQILDNTEDGIG